ncbi:hypothetical protein [Flavobacterium pectinovorum]|uniref:Uncharacterized protein n=1 Tax=Flavobacterium pectinovorum TaxID=29533 RepID=A0A502END8_9FLAO|nr:hypothetical protein [Flavobacterium pectinovorum]TPG39283.1 hypothetical protein EAH81_13630 [Flavobacterium pectinovorum]
MRNLFIVLIITIIPLFANAQGFNQSQLRNGTLMGVDERAPQLVQLPTMKPIVTLNHVEKAKAKLAREEQKLIKMARKAWDKEDDLKKEQEQLKTLENASQNSNDPNHQKKIETLKKQIAKSQEKVNEAKKEIELESKKVEDLENAIDDAKYTRHD